MILIDNPNYVIAICFLVVLSLIDVLTFNKENKGIPSAITTLFLLSTFVTSGTTVVYSGILAGLISLLFIDMDVFHGVPDIKVFIATGFIFDKMLLVLGFALSTLAVGVIYKLIAKRIIKEGSPQEIPFIPAIAIGFTIILFGMMFLWILFALCLGEITKFLQLIIK